ncbi:hypothetical protein [Burkholderia sp. Ac-20379]|nr:hypothetical protein [Burkholderia sp. Ac-20379]MBN3727898.1 hypothetical protein [Burkholderia sp. Ac-20379]
MAFGSDMAGRMRAARHRMMGRPAADVIAVREVLNSTGANEPCAVARPFC